AIDGTEVALAVHQGITQRERLGHAHDGVVYRRVAMRVVFTDHVTDHTGRCQIGLVPVTLQLTHGERSATVYRLEAVTHIRQRAAHDNAHGIVEIGLFEFVFDVDREDFFG